MQACGVRLWIVAAVAAAPCAAAAQQLALTPSETLACLTPVAAERGTPTYPQHKFDRKEGGVVSVDLDFTAPDRAPKVTVRVGDDHRALSDAVIEHVRKYRVPCLTAGQSARFSQEFRFVPTDGRKVQWLAPRDADDERRSQLLNCVQHKSPGSKPIYPMMALSSETQGTVVLRVKFEAPDMPPVIEVADDGQSSSLAAAARNFALDYRMPCYDGAPVSFTHFYTFRIDGAKRTVLKDVPLVSLLPLVKDIRRANVYFDFNEMGCPFDLRLRLHQPYGLNGVGEVGEPNPERRFFLDWLRRQQLDLPARTYNEIIGEMTTVSVPCTVLKLGTTSGGGASQ